MPPVTAGETFHPLRIAAVRHHAAEAVEIVFDVPPELASAFAFKPGQHVAIRVAIDGHSHRRTYSICAGAGDPLRIGIRRLDGGLVSTWASAHLKAGDTLDVATPQGRFTLPPPSGDGRHLLMLAAGAGITPILGMTIEALQTEPETRVTLVYGMRTQATAMFLAELEDLKDRYPARLDLITVISRAGEAEIALLAGRITGDKVRALAARLIDLQSVEHTFLCGPGDFIKQTRGALFDLGMARDRVHHEFFGGRPDIAAQTAVTPAPNVQPNLVVGAVEAVAILDGQRHGFVIARGQSVLAAALAAGLKAPYSCTAGMCSTCRARVVEGHVEMTANYSLEDWELRRGFVLTCQAMVTSERLVIDYDAM